MRSQISQPVAQSSTPPRSPASANLPKSLRAVVVQDGRVMGQIRQRRRETVTLGPGGHNTFIIASGSLPKSHRLFLVRGGRYELVLTEGMRGRIMTPGHRPVDFASLKAQGLLKRHGDFFYLPLNDTHRGKVVIGDVTVVFQFGTPPPAPPRLQLPAAARGSIWRRIDRPFAAALFGAFLVESPLITYLQYAPAPEAVTLATVNDRWAKLIVPEMPKGGEPKNPDQKTAKGGPAEGQTKAAKRKAGKERPLDEASAGVAKAARSAKIRESIAGRGMLAILGTLGEGSSDSAVADVFGQGGLSGDLDSAFDGIAGVGVATSADSRTTRGGGSGEAATIGGLATAGGGQVGLGAKAETRVGSVTTEGPEVDGSLDSDAIAKVVRSRMRMVQDCYEKELKRNAGLSGKIEVEFSISDEGRVIDARVASNGMGSEAVGECIVSRLRHWRFPKPEGGTVTVNFPFIFTPSG